MDRSNPGQFGDQDWEDSKLLYDRAAEIANERRVSRQDPIPEADRQSHFIARRRNVGTRCLEIPRWRFRYGVSRGAVRASCDQYGDASGEEKSWDK